MIRYEFFDYDVLQGNVHPEDIFEEERELAFKFIEDKKLQGSTKNFLFKRYNIPYTFDQNKNLMADINITTEIHREYFFNSPLSRLRSSEQYQEKVKTGREHIWNSYIEWIEGRCFRYLNQKEELNILDIGSRNVGWIEKLENSRLLSNLSLMGCLPPIKCEEKNEMKFNVIIALDILQRELEPAVLLRKIHSKLDDDGIVTFSFRSGTGFDVLALKEKNKSIFPPDHLFLPSIEGFSKLLDENGFDLKEITTPGQLDAEIIKDSVKKGECTDSLIVHLAENVSNEELQTFIQKNNLSSHVRAVAKKKQVRK